MRETLTENAEVREYRCPGENYSIDRTVHLGRLASFYAACRDCPHAHDTGTLAPSILRRLNATRREVPPTLSFCDEHARVRLDDASAAQTRRLAAALGVHLQHARVDRERPLLAVLASDGRAATAEALAAASEGLRWAGCDVVDIGAAAAPALAHSIAHLQADGGLLLGVEGGASAEVTLAFWGAHAVPFSAGGSLDAVREIYAQRLDRPTRSFGGLRRFDARELYLDGLAEHFHALRPLRFVLDTACQSLAVVLAELTRNVACEIITLGLTAPAMTVADDTLHAAPRSLARRTRRSPPLPCSSGDRTTIPFDDAARRASTLEHRVRSERAHFGIAIDTAGETCRLVDELGRTVVGDVWLVALARHLLAERANRSATVVVEEETSPAVVSALADCGAHVVRARSRRQVVQTLAREHGAIIAGGSSGRIWQRRTGVAADALAALALWLTVLSETDRSVSQVLADALAGGVRAG